MDEGDDSREMSKLFEPLRFLRRLQSATWRLLEVDWQGKEELVDTPSFILWMLARLAGYSVCTWEDCFVLPCGC